MGPGVAEDVATMGSQFGVQLCLLGHCRAQWSTVPRLTELTVAHVFSQVQSAVVSWLSHVLLKEAVLALRGPSVPVCCSRLVLPATWGFIFWV